MNTNDSFPSLDDIRASWDAKAEQWDQQVGVDGDRNRRLNSDPVLTRMLGGCAGLDLLDAGCGTGYLAIRLARAGARVTGVDHSEKMIGLARRRAAEAGVDARFLVASCMDLGVLPDACVDRVVSNYVLMDLPDLGAAVGEMHRVLRPGGRAVLVFSHPCFDRGRDDIQRMPEGEMLFRWRQSYFDRYHYHDSWGHFTTQFVAFHRPLSFYWRTFNETGFRIVDFDEPVVSGDHPELHDDELRRLRMTPWSVAFLLARD